MKGIEGRYKVPRMAGEGEKTAGAAGVSLRVVHYLSFSASAYAAARPEGNVPQKELYRSIASRVLGFRPRDIHGYWTWKPACAADVRLMLRASRKVIAARSEGMINSGQVQQQRARQDEVWSDGLGPVRCPGSVAGLGGRDLGKRFYRPHTKTTLSVGHGYRPCRPCARVDPRAYCMRPQLRVER